MRTDVYEAVRDLPHPGRRSTSESPAPCPEFARHLSDLIDGACSPGLDRWMRHHAAVCGVCGKSLALARALRSALRSMGREEPPVSALEVREAGPPALWN